MQVIELLVTKNKVVETDLKLAKMVKLCKNTDSKQCLRYHLLQRYVPLLQGNFGKTASFLHSISSAIYLSGKNVLSRPRVINAHLQQQDHVASQLCTVDFWLIDIWVLTVATK